MWLGFKSLFLGFLDDAFHCVRWLSTSADPLFCFLDVDGEVDAFNHWVVCSDLFDRAAITALAAIYSYDFVIRAIFCALTAETKCYHDFVVVKIC